MRIRKVFSHQSRDYSAAVEKPPSPAAKPISAKRVEKSDLDGCLLSLWRIHCVEKLILVLILLPSLTENQILTRIAAPKY